VNRRGYRVFRAADDKPGTGTCRSEWWTQPGSPRWPSGWRRWPRSVGPSRARRSARHRGAAAGCTELREVRRVVGNPERRVGARPHERPLPTALRSWPDD